MRIKEFVQKQLETGETAYRIAKNIGVTQIMINYYLDKDVKCPRENVAKNIYKKYGIVISPYELEEVS